MMEYCVGIDVGGTTVKAGIFGTDGTLFCKWSVPTDTSDGGKNVLPDMRDSLFEKLSEKGISPDDVRGIGIGVPGAVKKDGTVLGCVNIGWGTFNIVKEAERLFCGIRVKAGNDATLAALGEMWQGAARGHDDVVMITLGTGVGGGIIADGHIIEGATGGAGEIGHFPANPDETRVCSCGKKGCLEQYASATGIVNGARMLIKNAEEQCRPPEYTKALLGLEEITAKDVFDLAKAGDEAACDVVAAAGRYIGIAMAQIACTVNPEIFIIGGGVSAAGSILIDAVEDCYRKNAFYPCSKAQVRLASLGNDGGIYGAAALIVK